jgi:hypothetical protein
MKIINWRTLFKERINSQKRSEVIGYAKNTREKAEKRIDKMIAQVDGCGDRWFLRPIKPVDK